MDCIHRERYCTQCSLQFDSRHVYNLHVRLVHEQKILKKHIKNQPKLTKSIHGKDKSLPKSKFDSAHERKKEIKCQSCDKIFSEKGSMNRHVASVHEGMKPFKCEFCDKSFSQKGNSIKHVASVHEGKKPLTCEWFEHSFAKTNTVF